MLKTTDSSSESEYNFIDTQSSSATAEDVINLFKNKLLRRGFKSHEVDYMAKNGFRKVGGPPKSSYPFHK